jgi:hypothetical protein
MQREVSELESENEKATVDAETDSPSANREIKDGVVKMFIPISE